MARKYALWRLYPEAHAHVPDSKAAVTSVVELRARLVKTKRLWNLDSEKKLILGLPPSPPDPGLSPRGSIQDNNAPFPRKRESKSSIPTPQSS